MITFQTVAADSGVLVLLPINWCWRMIRVVDEKILIFDDRGQKKLSIFHPSICIRFFRVLPFLSNSTTKPIWILTLCFFSYTGLDNTTYNFNSILENHRKLWYEITKLFGFETSIQKSAQCLKFSFLLL